MVKLNVRNIATDTIRINDNVRVAEQSVKCPSCGSRYLIETYLDGKPTVDNGTLVKLDNTVHP